MIAALLVAASFAPPHPQDFAGDLDRAADAIHWLLTAQHDDGRWTADTRDPGAAAEEAVADDAFWDRVLGEGEDAETPAPPTARTTEARETLHDVGVTGLGLLAVLESLDHASDWTWSRHKTAADQAVDWLLSQQNTESGLLGAAIDPTFHYDHAIGTLALIEALDMPTLAEPRPQLEAACQNAVDYISRARNPYMAWRYSMPPIGDNDTSVTTWMTLACRAAEDLGLRVDDSYGAGVLGWLDSVTDPRTGAVGYTEAGSASARVPGFNVQFPADRNATLTAAGLLCRLELGQRATTHPVVVKHVKHMLTKLPASRDEGLDDALWAYFGTRAMHELGSRPWEAWQNAVLPAVRAAQVTEGDEEGSFAPRMAWSFSTGRAGTTALLALTLFDAVADLPGDRAAAADAPTPEAVRRSIDDALAWLASHQDDDGRWDADAFGKHDGDGKATIGGGLPTTDVGVTGLALLAFLGNGETRKHGAHAEAIARAARWLVSVQEAESGLIGERTGHLFLYDHAIATFALSELELLEGGAPDLAEPVRLAADLIGEARNPYGVWRYALPPNGENDTSVTVWMATALRSAQSADHPVDTEAFEATLRWVDAMTDEATARIGYVERGTSSSRVPGRNLQFPTESGEALTAAGLHARFLLGETAEDNPILRQHADLLLRTLPQPIDDDSPADLYYWHFGTLAMSSMGGGYWRAWKRAFVPAALQAQRSEGVQKGSWDPNSVWGYAGGRVYSTALTALALEVVARAAEIQDGR